MAKPHVYIIIINYRNWQDTGDCITALSESTYTNYSIIVVDNNSANQSIEILAERFSQIENRTYFPEQFLSVVQKDTLPKLTFIQNRSNKGFAGANNIVLKELENKEGYVWLLNPDMVPEKNTLAELVHFGGQHPPGTIIGTLIYSFHNKNKLLFFGGGRVGFRSASCIPERNKDRPGRLDYISGSSLFTRCTNFKSFGLLNEEYFLYWEETDWCFRAVSKGAKLSVCPTAICYDKISTVIGTGFLAHYYYCRNGLHFISGHCRAKLPLALASMKLRYLKRVLMFQWDRARGIRKGRNDFLKNQFHAIQ